VRHPIRVADVRARALSRSHWAKCSAPAPPCVAGAKKRIVSAPPLDPHPAMRVVGCISDAPNWCVKDTPYVAPPHTV
jgi:hypothetical protein